MNIQKREKGFTIIEVVLVLAIAGLIFLMVFIALPALQRTQRDTQRQNDMGRLQTAVNNYTTANRGNLPPGGSGSAADWQRFVDEYLTANGADTFLDPNGAPDGREDETYIITDAGEGTIQSPAENTIYATEGAICSQETASLAESAGSRKIAFRIALEGGGFYCVNN